MEAVGFRTAEGSSPSGSVYLLRICRVAGKYCNVKCIKQYFVHLCFTSFVHFDVLYFYLRRVTPERCTTSHFRLMVHLQLHGMILLTNYKYSARFACLSWCSVEIITINDKSLETNLHLQRFFTRAKQTVASNCNYTCPAPLPKPSEMLKTTLFL